MRAGSTCRPIGGDRETLTPGGHYAENNHIHHYGRWDLVYRPAIHISGVGLRASHNLIHHAPHAAILFGGQEHLFEYNEIHNVCHESHDCIATTTSFKKRQLRLSS